MGWIKHARQGADGKQFVNAEVESDLAANELAASLWHSMNARGNRVDEAISVSFHVYRTGF